MSYEFFVAKRYLTAKRKQAFISVITFISILGITIGVMALVIAIALITGFQADVQDKILGSTSHIMVSDFSGEGLKDYDQLISRIKTIKGVSSATPVVYDTVLLSGPYKNSGAILRGIVFDLEKESSPWLKELEQGHIPLTDTKREGILLGRNIAVALGAGIGDLVTVLTSSSRLSPVGLIPKRKKFMVAGIFHSGLYEFDSSTALISLEAAQGLFGLDNRVSMIHVNIEDIFKAPEISVRIREVLPPETYTTTWMELNKSLFSALKLEKKLMFFHHHSYYTCRGLEYYCDTHFNGNGKDKRHRYSYCHGSNISEYKEDIFPSGRHDRVDWDSCRQCLRLDLVLAGKYI